MQKPYKNISDTNTAFGNIFGSVDKDAAVLNYDKIYNQAMNLYDELDELYDDGFSILIDDESSKVGRQGMVDAIADLLVFLYGIPHFLGYNYKEKTSNTILKDILISHDKQDFYKHVFEDIKQLIDDLIDSISEKKSHTVINKNVEELDVYLMTLADICKINVDLLIDKVSKSNFSKLCKDKDETEATLKYYRDKGVEVYSAESPLKQEDGKPFYVVYSSKEQTVEGKVYRAHKFLKCINWFEPDISDI